MKKFLKNGITSSLACIMALGLMFANKQELSANMPEDSTASNSPTGFTNQYDDVFNGYANMETTMTGRVGYNYAITLPNHDDLLFGFDPRNTTGEVMDFSGIGSGWKIKLPYLDTDKQTIHRERGYSFPYETEGDTINTSANSNATYSLRLDLYQLYKNPKYNTCIQSEYEVYDASGRLVRFSDSSDNFITYEYSDDLLSKINYCDGSSVLFERFENEVHVIYTDSEESILLATFKLAEKYDRLVLSEIERPDDRYSNLTSASFEYITDSNDSLLLKKYDNGQHERTIEYLDNSYKIASYHQIYSDGGTSNVTYEYGEYDYISVFAKTDYREEYSYKKLDNNCFQITTKKFPAAGTGIRSSSTTTVNEFGQSVHNIMTGYSPGFTFKLTYEDGSKYKLHDIIGATDFYQLYQDLSYSDFNSYGYSLEKPVRMFSTRNKLVQILKKKEYYDLFMK